MARPVPASLHCLESSVFHKDLSAGSKPTTTQRGTTGDGVVYTGATFYRSHPQAGLDSDHGAKDNSMVGVGVGLRVGVGVGREGVLLHHTEE